MKVMMYVGKRTRVVVFNDTEGVCVCVCVCVCVYVYVRVLARTVPMFFAVAQQ